MTVFVVTGCASGIGRAVADGVVAAGDSLVATDIDLPRLTDHARASGWPTERTLVRALNVTDPAAWRQTIDAARERFGRVDVLVNVAGILRPGWAHETEDADVDRHLDINVKGVMHGTRYAAAAMVERGSGHIVNIASLAALAPIPGLSLYCASKYAVRGYSLAAAQELRRRGVAITVVCPDAVDTPMLDLQRDYPEAAMTFSGPRVLTTEEVAQAVLGPVLARRPLEYFMPPSRGWLARLGDIAPAAGLRLGPLLSRIGRRRQGR